VIGPAFALASAAGASGADLVAAICAGYSVLGGLAEPFGPTQDDGLMSAGVWGPSASAAVASRMLRLTAAQTANAIALAAGAAGGTFQYFYDQTEEKRLVVARAARAGVEAALLARAGEVGPRHALEGPAGLYALLSRLTGERPDYAQTPNVVARLDGPLFIYPKFFSASSSITPSLEALSPLVSNGLRSPAVERVTLRGDPARYEVVARKLTQFEVPSTLIGAKINYAFMVAFYLVHGVANAAALERARLDDRAVSELARRVRFEPVPGGAGEIVLQLRPAGSRTVTIQNIAPGSFAPLAPELRREKVRSLTQEALGASGGRIIERLARGLPTSRSSRNWIKVVDRALS
jgi:2-methylcitrate dehydratase PrpD